MVDTRPTRTVVERRGSGAGVVLGVIAVIILAVLAYMFLVNDNRETNAVTGAAESVGQAADSVGSAVTDKAK